jgi:HlyD family type I secretion membrane fusion protein
MTPRDTAARVVAEGGSKGVQAPAMQATRGNALQHYSGGEPGGADTNFMNPRRMIAKGTMIVLIFVVGFLGWASFAPLESAVTAPGVIVVESHRKTIQHLEGGIVKEILVAEGDKVSAGQPLIRLDETQAQTSLSLLQDQADALTGQEARLVAERDGAANIAFPPDLLARRDQPKVAEILRGEQNNFVARRNTLTKQIDILTQRNGENDRQIAGLASQQDAVEKQGTLVEQEASGVEDLYKQGLSTLPRVLALQRQAADLTGQRGQLIERKAQTELSSQENNLQMTNLRNQQLSSIATDLREAQSKKFDVLSRLNAAKDVMSRLDMIAPVSGKVVSLNIHTKGAVIKPGETVMEIVPDEDQLEVETHVRPDDADLIQRGMSAHVSFNAYKQRRLPQLTGTVSTVSADRLVDQRTGMAYFNVTVTVDAKTLRDYTDVKLMPGLPVDVAIATGTRTLMDYILAPIMDVVQKGMREK